MDHGGGSPNMRALSKTMQHRLGLMRRFTIIGFHHMGVSGSRGAAIQPGVLGSHSPQERLWPVRLNNLSTLGAVQTVRGARALCAVPMAYVHEPMPLLELGYVGREWLTKPAPLLGSAGRAGCGHSPTPSTVVCLTPVGYVVAGL